MRAPRGAMWLAPIIIAGLAPVLARAAPAGDRLTGISKDWSRYRVGAARVCTLATVDAQSGQVLFDPDACAPMAAAAQRPLGFALPRARTAVPIGGGRTIVARVVLAPLDPRVGPVACLKGKDDPTPCEAMPEMPWMRGGEVQIVVRGRAGGERVLASTEDNARAIKAIYASPDGARVVIVYTHQLQLGDGPGGPPVVTAVLGVDVSARLTPR
jgi:hypothetical protein